MKVEIILEQNNQGKFSAYMNNDNLDFGLNGFGNSVEEAKSDIVLAYTEMKQLFKESGNEMPDLEFEFKFDVASFLVHYSRILSLAGLERLTGVNQGQLSHYVTGRRKPSHKTVERIEKSIHKFASEIGQVKFAG